MGMSLYNGVKLPALPKVDKKFSHLLIAEYWFFGGHPYYVLYCFSDEPSTFSTDTGIYHGYQTGTNTENLRSIINIDTDTAWELSERTDSTNFDLDYIVWANYDVLNEDGTLYLAASDPVPVTQLNPAALMQSFFVGEAVKRCRR